jgi:hypothetical protein
LYIGYNDIQDNNRTINPRLNKRLSFDFVVSVGNMVVAVCSI